MSFFDRGRTSRGPFRGLLVTLVAVAAGVLVGHFVWNAATAGLNVNSASNRFRSFEHATGGLGERSGANGSGGSALSPGGSEGSGSTAEQGEESSESEGGVASSVTGKVDPGLVDINTELGLEGGAAAGTGMVVTSNGEVITNNHVITGATRITATDVGNGTTYTARVVGYDYGHDIAVLQLEGASNLKTVSLGDSSSLSDGQNIATIGNAGGAGGTPSATAGRVAGLDQSITAGDELDGTQEHLSGLVQIAGDVQPGDSGGPLVNSSGEVLGMDTAASTTFQFQSSANEAFAIPIGEVKAIAGQILEDHETETIHIGTTGMLGVLLQSQSEEGAVVENVISGSPAAENGLGAGDVITAINGSSVTSPTALSHVILKARPGNGVKVAWHTPEGEQHTATITLAEGPPQ